MYDATYPHRRRSIHHGVLTRKTTSTCGSGGIRFLHMTCILTMRKGVGVGSRELPAPAVCGISKSTKIGATDSVIR